MTEWVHINDSLPEIGEWVLTFTDHRANPQDFFLKKLFNRPLFIVQPGQLRSVCPHEGWPEWQQCMLASGHPMRILDNVTMWRPLESPPWELMDTEDYMNRHQIWRDE